jgi:hypothetical protein
MYRIRANKTMNRTKAKKPNTISLIVAERPMPPEPEPKKPEGPQERKLANYPEWNIKENPGYNAEVYYYDFSWTAKEKEGDFLEKKGFQVNSEEPLSDTMLGRFIRIFEEGGYNARRTAADKQYLAIQKVLKDTGLRDIFRAVISATMSPFGRW